MTRTALALLAVPLMLGGCTTVGPSYTGPASALAHPDAAHAAFAEAAPDTTIAPLPPRWWALYDDPALNELEQQALAANTDLRLAGANLARARAMQAIAQGAGEPQVDLSVAAERARLSGESFLLNEPLPAATLGDAGLGMHYQLDLFGQIRRSVEAARADADASAATVGAVQVTIAADVARAYIAGCGANEALALDAAALKLAVKNREVARALQAAGRTSADDVTRAEAQVAEAEALAPVQRSKASAAHYRLAFLLGRKPADLPPSASQCTAIPTIAHPLPVGDAAMLLARRPDLRVAERRVAAASARIGVATAALYPHVTIGLSAGSSGFLKDLGTAPANAWSLGGLIHWSVPDGAAHARVRAARADADAALAAFDATVLAALRDTETALAAYAQGHDRLQALQRARDDAEQMARNAHRLRAAGRSPVQATLGSDRAALSAQMAESSAREAQALDQVNLFLALGGGW